MGQHGRAAWRLRAVTALLLGLCASPRAADWPAFTSPWVAATTLVAATTERLEATWTGIVTNDGVTNRTYGQQVLGGLRGWDDPTNGVTGPFMVPVAAPALLSTNLIQVGVQTNVWTNGAAVVTNLFPLYNLDVGTVTNWVTNHPAPYILQPIVAAMDAGIDLLLDDGVYVDPSKAVGGTFDDWFATVTATNWEATSQTAYGTLVWHYSSASTPTGFPRLSRHRAWEVSGVGRIVTGRVVYVVSPPVLRLEMSDDWRLGEPYMDYVTNIVAVHATTSTTVHCFWTHSTTGALLNAELAAISTAYGHPHPDTGDLWADLFNPHTHGTGRGFGGIGDGQWTNVADWTIGEPPLWKAVNGALYLVTNDLCRSASGTNVLYTRLTGTAGGFGCFQKVGATNVAELVETPRWLYRQGLDVFPGMVASIDRPALRVASVTTNESQCDVAEPPPIPNAIRVTITGGVFRSVGDNIWQITNAAETVSVTATGVFALAHPYRTISHLSAFDLVTGEPWCYPKDGVHIAVIWTNESPWFTNTTPWYAAREFFDERRRVLDLMRYTLGPVIWANVAQMTTNSSIERSYSLQTGVEQWVDGNSALQTESYDGVPHWSDLGQVPVPPCELSALPLAFVPESAAPRWYFRRAEHRFETIIETANIRGAVPHYLGGGSVPFVSDYTKDLRNWTRDCAEFRQTADLGSWVTERIPATLLPYERQTGHVWYSQEFSWDGMIPVSQPGFPGSIAHGHVTADCGGLEAWPAVSDPRGDHDDAFDNYLITTKVMRATFSAAGSISKPEGAHDAYKVVATPAPLGATQPFALVVSRDTGDVSWNCLDAEGVGSAGTRRDAYTQNVYDFEEGISLDHLMLIRWHFSQQSP